MSRGGYPPQRQYDDFTLSSTGDRSDIDGTSAFHDVQQPFPLKSTLPSEFRRSTLHSKASRQALPKGWSPALNRQLGRYNEEIEDVTLSTELTSQTDDYPHHNDHQQRHSDSIYEDNSLIPGVGRGFHRGNGTGGASYSAHRDLLASSHFAVHPSPDRALRHEQLRASTSKAQLPSRQYQKSVSSATTTTSDGEDSESENESSSTSTTSHAIQPKILMHSKAESTGNHQLLDESVMESQAKSRNERPRLDARALDEMDRAVRKGKAFLQHQIPHSPSPAPSRQMSPQLLRSKKEERIGRHAQSPFKPNGQRVHSGEERKPSDSSSNGKKQAGTAGSTSGDTLVEGRGREHILDRASMLQRGQGSPFMRLPSGRRMGRSVIPGSNVFLPDVTGMTSALESPVKTMLGVEHRNIPPQVIQARHLQTTEARLDEFNDLAQYVKIVEKELDQTQKKIQAVDERSTLCVKEVDALRSEWSHYKQARGKKASAHHDRGGEVTTDEDMDDYDGKVQAINNHIVHLTRDLHSHRETMEKMRIAKEKSEQAKEVKMMEKQKRLMERRRAAEQSQTAPPRSSSPIKSVRPDEEEEEEAAARMEMIALRKQVNKVAKEVERLRMIVDADEAVVKVPSEKIIRFSAVNPILKRSIGVGNQSPFRRSIGTSAMAFDASDEEMPRARTSSPPPTSVRGFQDDDDADIGDETLRPAQKSNQNEVDEDVSVIAQSRAERVFEVIDSHGGHSEKTCTVCRGKAKSDRRQQARRERVQQQSTRRDVTEDDGDREGDLISSLLDAALYDKEATKAMPRSSKHHPTIRRLIKEHMDEFHHHRMLYCELADELKAFSPDLNRVKRRILAEHVMEAVEGLEYRARRINILQDLIGECKFNGDESEMENTRSKVKRKSRNNPLNIDGGDLYRRVVST